MSTKAIAKTTVLTFIFSIFIVGSIEAVTVTFDEPITFPPGHTFETQGYTFDVETGHYHIESGVRYGTSSVTNSLVIDDHTGDNSLATMESDSLPFVLQDFQIKSWGDGWGSTAVNITGYLSGGGSVFYTHNASGIDVWDTVTLGWSNLLSVKFDGTNNASGGNNNHFRLDDINVVPEPATMVLLGLGGLVAIRRSKNRK